MRVRGGRVRKEVKEGTGEVRKGFGGRPERVWKRSGEGNPCYQPNVPYTIYG